MPILPYVSLPTQSPRTKQRAPLRLGCAGWGWDPSESCRGKIPGAELKELCGVSPKHKT